MVKGVFVSLFFGFCNFFIFYLTIPETFGKLYTQTNKQNLWQLVSQLIKYLIKMK